MLDFKFIKPTDNAIDFSNLCYENALSYLSYYNSIKESLLYYNNHEILTHAIVKINNMGSFNLVVGEGLWIFNDNIDIKIDVDNLCEPIISIETLKPNKGLFDLAIQKFKGFPKARIQECIHHFEVECRSSEYKHWNLNMQPLWDELDRRNIKIPYDTKASIFGQIGAEYLTSRNMHYNKTFGNKRYNVQRRQLNVIEFREFMIHC